MQISNGEWPLGAPPKPSPSPQQEGSKGPSGCGFAPVEPSAENAPWRALLRKGALHRCKSALANGSQRPPEALPKPQERCLTTLPSDGFAHFQPFAETATQSTGKRPKICNIPALTFKTLRLPTQHFYHLGVGKMGEALVNALTRPSNRRRASKRPSRETSKETLKELGRDP